MSKVNAVITGIGGYVPEYILTNEELSRMVETNDEWIYTRVGIKERRILNEEGLGSAYMARKACRQLLAKTQVDPQTIDCVICATTTGDYHFPSNASIIIGKLGLKQAHGFDVSCACCGFLYILDMASAMIQSGRYHRIICVAAEKMSSMVDAGAVMVEATEEEGVGFQDSFLRTDGLGLPFLHMKAGGSVCPASHYTVDHRMHYVYQEGRTVFRYAVTSMADDIQEVMKRNNLTMNDVNWLIPHEANMRIIEAVAKRLETPMEKILVNIEHYGNTSAASIALALWDFEKKLKKGDNVLLTAFGAGFVHGASFYKWGYDGDKVGKNA